MKHKTILLEGAKQIDVFDDVFNMQFMADTYLYATMSNYRIGWGDTVDFNDQVHKYLHASYTVEDINALGILDKLVDTPIASLVDGMQMTKAVMNMSVPSDSYFTHVHPESKVILYYVNTKWQDGWFGDTMFYADNGKDIAFASPYTPNRVIVFDGQIPHALRPQSQTAPHYRFTLALIYDKVDV
jgi:hypothetical protein